MQSMGWLCITYLWVSYRYEDIRSYGAASFAEIVNDTVETNHRSVGDEGKSLDNNMLLTTFDGARIL